MKEIKPIIKFVPLAMLGVCCILTAFTGFEWYPKLYEYLSQMIGCSIVTNVYFLYFAYRFNMCVYTKVATIGLITLNILDTVNIFYPIGGVYVKGFYILYVSIVGYFLLIISFLFLALRKETDNGATK